MNDFLMKLTTEITVKAMGEGNASWIGNPKAVADFLDATSLKLEQISRRPPRQSE